jgi:hypothetical protein
MLAEEGTVAGMEVKFSMAEKDVLFNAVTKNNKIFQPSE